LACPGNNATSAKARRGNVSVLVVAGTVTVPRARTSGETDVRAKW